MLFDIRLSECKLVSSLVDHLSICIKEPNSSQECIKRVVKEDYLPDVSSNWLTIQLPARLNLEFSRLKLWVKFIVTTSFPHCNKKVLKCWFNREFPVLQFCNLRVRGCQTVSPLSYSKYYSWQYYIIRAPVQSLEPQLLNIWQERY